MFAINGTLVIFVASFLLFMILLNEIMLKPVGRIIDERNDLIQKNLEAAKQARLEAAGKVDNYESHVKEIRHEAHSLITSTVAAANKEKNDKLSQIHKTGSEKLESAKASIAAERETLIDEMVAHERDLVEAITQKILGESVAVNLDANKVRQNLEGAS
jgi:F-type H+-transporting ATPase subunit b